MAEIRTCPKCGTELSDDAPAGLCPKCLILAGLESADESQEQADRGAYEPTALHPHGILLPEIAALAPHFPQLEILELLGHGGMGAVYKARQTKLDRLVALKIIRPESADDPAFAERFNREARTLARLSHPNIVAIHDFGEVQISDPETDARIPRTLYYFLMEYVDGANLRELIQGSDIPPDQALAIVPQICDALQYAHDEGVVHRDIKPENILLDRKGRVKIADFGLAKLASGSEQDYTLTATHQVMGTLRYMAPEQMEGSHSVDHRADLYSLGVVFYEMLTGEVPAGHFDPPSLKRNIDSRLDRIVLRALARDRDKRYQHASEIGSHVNFIRGNTSSDFVNVSDKEFLDAPFPGPSTMMERAFSVMLRGFRGGAVRKTLTHHNAPAYIAMLLCVAGISTVFTAWALELTNAMQPDAMVYGYKDPCGVLAACFQFLLLLILIAAGTSPQRTHWRPWAIMLLSFGAAGWLAIFKVTTLALGNWRIEGGYLTAIGICVALLVTGAWDLREYLQSAEQRERKTPEPIETGPRFSRKAIVGACFLPLALPALAVAVSVLVALMSGSDSTESQSIFVVILVSLLLVPALILTFTTTILGFLAIGDIRHSKGKLTGFGLAFFDAFCFPALLLGAVFMLPGIMFRNIYVLLVTGGIAVFTGIWLLTHFWNRLNPTSEPADDRQEEDSLPEKRTFAWSLFFVVFLLSALGHGLIGLAIIQVRLIWSVVGLLGIWFVLGAISRYHLHKPGRSACLLNLMISLLISLGLIGFCIAFWETAYPLFVIPLSFLACLGGAVLSEDLLDALEQESEVGESNPELTSQSVPAATPASLPAEPSDRVAHTPEHRAVHTETDSSLSDPDLEISRLEMQIKGPATAMAVVAVLGYLFMLAILAGKAYLTFDHGRIENQLFELALFAVAILLILLATATILFGAFQMRRLEHYEWCLTAGILAMIPWTGPVYLISLPVGIWAFRTLRRPDVREAFLTKAVERQQLAQQASTNELDRQANLLFTTSIINWIGLPVGLAIATVAILLTGDEKLIRDKDTWPILFIVIPGWFVPANAALTVAALKLKRREWYWFSLAGCLLAGVIPPGLFLGLPVGVWTFILICSSKVRGEFSQESSAKNQADASGTSTDASTATTNQKATGKYLLIACLTVIPLAIVIVIVVWLLMQRPPANSGSFSKEVITRMSDAASHDSTLHEAAESGDVARVIKLLDAGANVNDKDVDGQTPLMRAAANGHSALCQTLMVLGASANERDNQKRTAFMLAAENGHSGVIAAFFELEYIGRHVSAKSEVRGLNLDWRLLKKYDLDAELSDHFPIDVDAQDDKGETALMKAAARGDLVTLQALHNGDTAVDETLRDNRGFTPLMHAVINGHTTLIRNLADPLYKQYSSPPPNQTIPRVSLSGKVAINSPSCYLELENLRLVDNDGRTALQLAEALGEDEISKLLRRHLDTLIANATDVIEQGGPLTKEAYRYRGIAYQILGEQEKAESDFKRSEQPGE